MPYLYEALDLKPEEVDVVLKAFTRYALVMGGGLICIDDKEGRPWFSIDAERLTDIGCEVHSQLMQHITQADEGRLRIEWHGKSRK